MAPATAVANGASCSLVKGASGALEREEYGKFVQFFRQASPYIEGHRSRTFVVVIPGEVLQEAEVLASLMADIALLHDLGARLVVVLGAHQQIDAALEERGSASYFVGGYRVTCAVALEAAVEAAGRSRTAVERYLSRGPSVPVFRRHSKGEGEMHFGPALNVVSGNYVAAKRRGVHDGVDFGFTGEVCVCLGVGVFGGRHRMQLQQACKQRTQHSAPNATLRTQVRFVARDAILSQLDINNIVLLSNLGFTAGRCVAVQNARNCHTRHCTAPSCVATRCAGVVIEH